MVKKFFILAFLVTSICINAQKFELGNVSIAELTEKVSPADTNAVAAILYNKAKTVFVYDEKIGFTAVHKYEFRIKIYKKEGLHWATYKVPYYVGYENLNDDTVSFSNAVTYNLENGALVKTKLNNEGSFKKNINEYWKEAAITMPNVKVGSVIEFKYTLKSENIVKFPTFTFQYDIPVNFSEYKTEIPELFIYKPIQVGIFKIHSEAKIANGYQSFSNQYHQTVNLSFQQINSVYSAENIPALHDETYVDNIANYTAAVRHELEKTRFPDAPEKNYTQSWEDVAKTIFKEKDFAKQLNEHSYFDAEVRRIAGESLSEPEKISAILKFVQNKMHWDGEYAYWFDKGARKAYEDGTGNSAEINFILIAMLRAAGIKASPVLTSTIDHGIPIFPNRTIFNYIVAAADVGGKYVVLDAVNHYTSPDILPFYALNWTGRLIRADGTTDEINLVPTIPSKANYNILVSVEASGKIHGKYRSQKTDYNALRFREKQVGDNQQEYLEKLENDNNFKISGYVIENKNTDVAKPVIETFNFTSDDECEIIGDKMFISPLLFLTETKNPFVQEKRELPIYFGYPTAERYNINFEIPAGYAVESMPKSVTIETPEKIGLFTFRILTSENKIQVLVNSEINAAMVSADFYESLKEFSKKAIEKQNEKIILKKI